jgi:hypothetical protein
MDGYYQVNNQDEELLEQHKPKNQVSSLYFITHLILSFFAIFLSWRCSNKKFNILHFIAALCCPHVYIIWALATHGGCGVFDKLSCDTTPSITPSV